MVETTGTTETDMEAREQRGQDMAQSVKIIPQGTGWIVPSSTGSGNYKVYMDPEAPKCTCPDYEKRGKKCKHIFAVEYSLRAVVTSDGETTEATLTETKTVT